MLSSTSPVTQNSEDNILSPFEVCMKRNTKWGRRFRQSSPPIRVSYAAIATARLGQGIGGGGGCVPSATRTSWNFPSVTAGPQGIGGGGGWVPSALNTVVVPDGHGMAEAEAVSRRLESCLDS